MAPASIAVLIPCYNEELTVARVVSSFRDQLPEAAVYVFDNGSTDATRSEAVRAGAVVRTVPERGKGNVVRAMFASADADICVLVDGDDTYPAHRVYALIDPIRRGHADMTVGSRLACGTHSRFQLINRFGNIAIAWLVSFCLGICLTDVLSGYRAFSRRFIEAVELQSQGFEVEMDLTMEAVALGMRIAEVPVDLTPRPDGSYSKIRIARDGWQILKTMATRLVRSRPDSASVRA
jgi:glycosyltransferase involved in cell wall biosynthesis